MTAIATAPAHARAGLAKQLSRLLRERLGKYRRLIAWMVVLQTIQTIATLTLPTLSAHIIDKGSCSTTTPTSARTGALMLGASLVQVIFASVAVYLGAQVAMGFGRDVRGALFHTVTGFSAREVGSFGAPSLITRITNDVQQVQLLVVDDLHDGDQRPVHDRLRQHRWRVHEDVGLSVILVVAIPAAAILLGLRSSAGWCRPSG